MSRSLSPAKAQTAMHGRLTKMLITAIHRTVVQLPCGRKRIAALSTIIHASGIDPLEERGAEEAERLAFLAAARLSGPRLPPRQPEQVGATDEDQRQAQRVEPGHHPGQQAGDKHDLDADADADAEHVRQRPAKAEIDAARRQHQVVRSGCDGHGAM